jgi:ATP-dependent HslUV protease, peptidase subunit HslV
MSTIVVVKKNGKIAIAADTLSMFGERKVQPKYMSNRSKIHKSGNSYIGIIGSVAHNNVVESLITRHKRLLSFRSTQEIFETYRKLHPILKEEYYINTSEGNDDDEYESSQISALIANPYGIFGMYSWREVIEYEHFWSIGSGSEYALGAMFTAYNSHDNPEDIARLGIEASCEFDSASGLPYTLHAMKWQKPDHQGGRKVTEARPSRRGRA